MDISVVIPAYNEEESIHELSKWIANVCVANDISYEIIFIDDGSSDSTWKQITTVASDNSKVKGFRFRRNYGNVHLFGYY